MSGASALGWVGAGLFAANTIASIDAAKSAKHQARVQADLQNKQMEEARAITERELTQTAQFQEQQLAAQRSAQSASIAQANRAAAESRAMMDRQLKAAEEATNRANMKRPNASKIIDQATQSGRSGASGTMLTGSQGIDTSTLTLGKNTLLGA